MTQTVSDIASDGPVGRSRRWRLAALGGIAAVLALLITLFLTTSTALAASHVVTTTADAPDAAPGDGICASADGDCTLRAALQEANATIVADQVVVPAGTYVLTSSPTARTSPRTVTSTSRVP